MRAAPAISAPLDDCRPERVVITLLYGATGAAVAGWAAAQALPDSGPLWPLLGLACGALAGWLLAQRLLPGDVTQLAWDGSAWFVQRRAATGAPDSVALIGLQQVFDLGPWVLLRAREAQSRQHWLVLRERRVGAGWHLLRVALAAHGRGRP